MSAPNEEVAVVTLDWAQKLLPQGYRETQREYFGKRGLPWHITHIQIQREGLHYYHYLTHLFEAVKQDAQAVIAILYDVCRFLKEKTYVKKIILRSDNAGCYKSQELLAAIPSISSKTGIEILRYTFSESQNGKGPSDRGAAIAKRKAKNFLNAQNDIKSAADFFTSLTGKDIEDGEPACKKEKKSVDGKTSVEENAVEKPKGAQVEEAAETSVKSNKRKSTSFCVKPIASMSVFYTKLIRSDYKTSTKFDKITELGDFIFQSEDTVARRFAFIGIGKMYDQVIEDNLPLLENQASHIPDEIFALKTRRSTAQAKKDMEVEETPLDESTDSIDTSQIFGHHSVYECPICKQRFLSEKGFKNHIDKGAHKVKTTTEPMTDIAVKFFASNSQGYNPISKKLAEEIAQQSGSSDDLTVFASIEENEGWALPARKRSTRFNEKQKTFLNEIFQKGEESGEKLSPELIQKQMAIKSNDHNAPFFEVDELMNKQQIQSYLTRLAAAKKKEKQSEERRKRAVNEEENEDNEEDEVEFEEQFDIAEEYYAWVAQNLENLLESSYDNI